MQTFILSSFLYRRDPVCLSIFAKLLDNMRNTLNVKLDTWPSCKLCNFVSVCPKMVRPLDCMKIHPIAIILLLTLRALVHPLGFLKQGSRSQLLSTDPFIIECLLIWVTTVWQPALSEILPSTVSSLTVPVCHKNVFTRPRKYKETHSPDSGI